MVLLEAWRFVTLREVPNCMEFSGAGVVHLNACCGCSGSVELWSLRRSWCKARKTAGYVSL